MNTTTTTEKTETKTIIVPGLGEVDVKVAAEIAKALDGVKEVSEARKEITKESIKAKAKAKYEADRAKKMEDPVFAAKMAKRAENKLVNAANAEKKKADSEARKALRDAAAARIAKLLEDSGSKLKADRIVRAEVVEKKAHGLGSLPGQDAVRGYKAILVYTAADGSRSAKNQTFDLDVTGTGVLADMKAQADACLLSFLKSAR